MAGFERYIRQVSLEEIGAKGQEAISRLKVLVVGAGGLGSPAALYLAAAGVGFIGIVDSDSIEISNLQRQILYRDADIGSSKAVTIGSRLSLVSPDVEIEGIESSYTSENAKQITDGYDVVIGATDNFESRKVIASTCHQLGIPYVYAGINRFEVQVMSVRPGETSCFGCVYGEALDNEEEPVGPLGGVAGVGGTLQAVEALKVGVGFGGPLYDRLLVLDTLNMNTRTVPVLKRKDCGICAVE